MDQAMLQCQSCRNTLTITGLGGVVQAAQQGKVDARHTSQPQRQKHETAQTSASPPGIERPQPRLPAPGAGVGSPAASRMDDSFIVLDRSGRRQQGGHDAQPPGALKTLADTTAHRHPH
jgi:hypothetical protein